jgi:hypothetical protein
MPVLTAASVACIGFWLLGWLALHNGHPNEDAYILFKYVDNLVAGDGIVFYPGGPPTEGATDFLWMLLLAALVLVGTDVATAAWVWNGLGAGLAAGIFAATVRGSGTKRPWLWSLAVAFLVLMFHGAIAAMSGFSSMLFSALMLLGCVLVGGGGSGGGSSGGSRWLPVLGLVLALFRPEGAVPGVAFALVGLFQARRLGAATLRPYLVVTAVCFLAGVAYLAWHRAYFGFWLPLSVYVKSGGMLLPGLGNNLRWLHHEIGPLPFLIACVWILVRHRPPKAEVLRCMWAVVPVLLLLVPLAFALQTQNVRWRFQAPVMLAIALFTWRLYATAAASAAVAPGAVPTTAAARTRTTWVVTAVIMLLAMTPTWVVGIRRTWQLISHPNPKTEYTATFAPRLGELLDSTDTNVLTEAGILAYWSRSRIVDVVGLNDARFVHADPPRMDVILAAEHPDVIMFNAYEVLDLEALRVGSTGRLVTIDRDRLAGAIRGAGGSPDRARQAAAALARFLAGHEEYELRVVFLGRNNHVYGFRKSHPALNRMLAALESSCAVEHQPSYLELKQGRR